MSARLIERSRRNFRVTKIGRAFYERCVAILAAEDARRIDVEIRSSRTRETQSSIVMRRLGKASSALVASPNFPQWAGPIPQFLNSSRLLC